MNPRVLYRAASYATDARSSADAVISALTPAAWYRNATGVTESGGFASQWDDYSGNGRHLVQGVGTNQPAYSAGVLTFDGADNFMDAASWSMVQPETIYIVFQQISWAAADRIFDGPITQNTGTLYQDTSTPSLNLWAGAAIGVNANLAVGSYGIVCVVINNASSSTRVNNTTKVSGIAGANDMGGFRLARIGSTGPNYGNIAVKEIVIFAAAHDDTTQDSVITALNNALTVF